MAVLLGAKPPIIFKEYVLATSQTWTAPETGTIMVTCTGGGGQGGLASNGNLGDNSSSRARGGGAGGFSQKTIPVKVGDTFTVVVGAAGRNANTAPNGTVAGTSGGESTFDNATAISTIALDSNGGAGGGAVNGSSGVANLAGAAGGTASGGDINVAGGAGGAIVVDGNSTKDSATGGGAVSMYGLPFAGGSLTFNGAGIAQIATGGAGCFGAGGTFTQAVGANTQYNGGTQGGGNTRGALTFVEADLGTNAVEQNANSRGGFSYSHNHPAGTNSLGTAKPQGKIDGEFLAGPISKLNGSVDLGFGAFNFPGSGGPGVTCQLSGATAYMRSGIAGSFAGGGGGVVKANTNGGGVNSAIATSNTEGGVGGGGSGGFCQHNTFNISWKGGGQGLVIISYIG